MTEVDSAIMSAWAWPRTAMWTLLFIAALGNGLRHWQSRKSRDRLYWAIVLFIFLASAQTACYLMLVLAPAESQTLLGVIYLSFDYLDDSLFMALMLAIAAGFCVTQSNLGRHKWRVVGTPIGYLGGKVIVVISYLRFLPLVAEQASHPDTPLKLEFMFWCFCMIIGLKIVITCFLLAICFVYDSIRIEIKSVLQKTEEKEADTEAAKPRNAAYGSTDDMALKSLTEQGEYAMLPGDNLGAPLTMQERLHDAAQVKTLKHFRLAVTISLVCYAMAFTVFLVMIRTVKNFTLERLLTTSLILLEATTGMQWILMAGLCYIFRPSGSTPYLLLKDLDEDAETILTMSETRTELGPVLSSGASG